MVQTALCHGKIFKEQKPSKRMCKALRSAHEKWNRFICSRLVFKMSQFDENVWKLVSKRKSFCNTFRNVKEPTSTLCCMSHSLMELFWLGATLIEDTQYCNYENCCNETGVFITKNADKSDKTHHFKNLYPFSFLRYWVNYFQKYLETWIISQFSPITLS